MQDCLLTNPHQTLTNKSFSGILTAYSSGRVVAGHHDHVFSNNHVYSDNSILPPSRKMAKPSNSSKEGLLFGLLLGGSLLALGIFCLLRALISWMGEGGYV